MDENTTKKINDIEEEMSVAQWSNGDSMSPED